MTWNTVKQWFVRNLDVLTFGGAVFAVMPLMAWWSVLVRRNIFAMDTLMRVHAEMVPDAATRALKLAEVDRTTERYLFMITGETATAVFLFVVMMLGLFTVARQRAAENRRMRTMLQLTSHQLKTPLAGVRMLLQSLDSGVVPEDQKHAMFERGISECDRLEHLVETILAYQRSVARKQAKLEAMPTAHLVGEILNHRQQTSGHAEATWAKREAVSVTCDPDGVRVVLENLLDIARKYGGDKVELHEAVVGNRWRLEVRDQGQGFEPSHAERLFEPFEREPGSGAAHGSGLGLYIARQLARKMNGSLTASSPGTGQGSTFVFELPLARSAPRAAAEEVARG